MCLYVLCGCVQRVYVCPVGVHGVSVCTQCVFAVTESSASACWQRVCARLVCRRSVGLCVTWSTGSQKAEAQPETDFAGGRKWG